MTRVDKRPPANPTPSALPGWKKGLFAVVAVGGFFLLLEAALAVLGVRPLFETADPYIGFAGNIPLYVEARGSDGEEYLTTGPSKAAWFNRQRFAAHKPAGAYRIFSVGGSTTYGRPYTDPFSFSGWLRELLLEADPTRQWEVINAGGVSYASYRVAVVMEELAAYEPDLFIVYSGHNEFLERRTYRGLVEAPRGVTRLGGLLSRTRIAAAGSKLFPRMPERRAEANILAAEVDTILAHSAGPRDYRRDDAFRAQVLEHYEFNLRRMAKIAADAGAEVVFVTPASNLKDCSPFRSEASTEAGEIDDAIGLAAPAERLTLLDEALALDPRRADWHYSRGQTLLALGRRNEARAALLRALEEDVCPLRAIPAMVRIVRQVAAESGARLVDFAAYIDDRSGGLPGNELFLDHVHPSMDGYRELALLLLDDLEAAGDLVRTAGWTDATVDAVRKRVEARLDERQLATALRNLALVFGWAGKTEEAKRIAQRAIETVGHNADSYRTLGRAAAAEGRPQEALAHLRRSLELDSRQAPVETDVALALLELGRDEEAIEALERALAIDPTLFDALLTLGLARSANGDHELAIQCFQSALDSDPRSYQAHNNLGVEFVSLGRTDEGIAHFERALAIHPEFTDALVNYGRTLAQQGRLVEAERYLRRALNVGPQTAAMHFNLGVVLQNRADNASAVESYARALDLDPLLTGAHHNIAMSLLELGRDEEAVNRLRDALQRDPQFGEQFPDIRDAVLGRRGPPSYSTTR